jgi:hypothetical protein
MRFDEEYCLWHLKVGCRYGDWARTFLNKTCGASCANIRVLPIFDLSLPRYDSHHGSFGRGRFDDKATDCRHFCNNVVDVWNTVFFNMLCAWSGCAGPMGTLLRRDLDVKVRI